MTQTFYLWFCPELCICKVWLRLFTCDFVLSCAFVKYDSDLLPVIFCPELCIFKVWLRLFTCDFVLCSPCAADRMLTYSPSSSVMMDLCSPWYPRNSCHGWLGVKSQLSLSVTLIQSICSSSFPRLCPESFVERAQLDPFAHLSDHGPGAQLHWSCWHHHLP